MRRDFLTEILTVKKREVAELADPGPICWTDCRRDVRRPFGAALARPGISLIAEIKKASPSKGLLRPDLDAAALARAYEVAGATAISVVTDKTFFQGDLEFLAAARSACGLPILRKDFVIDRRQIFESVIAGADAVLLIVAALNDDDLADLLACGRDAGIESLVEAHDRAEIERAVRAGANIFGVNNRNLTSFEVKLDTTFQLLPAIPRGAAVVSESGIQRREQVRALAAAGVDAILVGEALATAADPAVKIRELLCDE